MNVTPTAYRIIHTVWVIGAALGVALFGYGVGQHSQADIITGVLGSVACGFGLHWLKDLYSQNQEELPDE